MWGYEIDPEFVALAEKRIEPFRDQISLFE